MRRLLPEAVGGDPGYVSGQARPGNNRREADSGREVAAGSSVEKGRTG